MKLGIITDIHEHVGHLRTALAHFRQEQVDQVVVLGDVFETGKRIDETCRLLLEAKAVGVWGNHDFNLCVNPSDELRAKYTGAVIDFMTSLQPRLEIANGHFSHVEPWLDPEKIADLWYIDGPPDAQDKLDRIFKAVPHRILFAGHFHKWLLATPEGIRDWKGEVPTCLEPDRCFVVIGALCEGQFAIFDTESSELQPFTGS